VLKIITRTKIRYKIGQSPFDLSFYKKTDFEGQREREREINIREPLTGCHSILKKHLAILLFVVLNART